MSIPLWRDAGPWGGKLQLPGEANRLWLPTVSSSVSRPLSCIDNQLATDGNTQNVGSIVDVKAVQTCKSF